MINMKKYSVSLLKESSVRERKNEDRSKIFEESLVLIQEEKDFFIKNPEQIF